MATKKRPKVKAKSKKKKKPAARKQVTRRKVRVKKKVARKSKPKKKTPARARPKTPGVARRPAAPRPLAVAAPLTTPPPGGVRIGIVTHYYSHLSVAIIRLESGSLREGDFVHIKGHTTDFSQSVGSMEVEHMHVSEVYPGQSFGLKVREHAREHDVVYKVASI